MRILAFVFAGCLLAQQPETATVPEKVSKPEDKCSVEGHVTDSMTGAPLRKVEVVLRPVDGKGEAYDGRTDAAGHFLLKNIEPGRYSAMATRNAYVQQTYGSRSMSKPGTPFTLTAGQKVTAIDFKLVPQSIMTGRVVDAEGDPVASAGVRMMQRAYVNGKKVMIPGGGGQTNDLGEYRIPSLAAGKYYLQVESPRQTNWDGMKHNADAMAEQGLAATYYPGATDAAAAVAIDVPAGQTVHNGDLVMQSSRTFRVQGLLTGMSGEQAMLVLFPRDDTFIGMSPPIMAQVRGKKHEFEFSGVIPGAYTLNASLMEADSVKSANMQIDVTREDVLNLRVPLESGMTLSGTLRKVGSGELPTADIHVFIQSKGQLFNMGSRPTAIKDDGTFQFTGIQQQSGEINVWPLNGNAYVKSIRLGTQDAVGNTLDFSTAANSVLEIVVSTEGGELSGIVNGADGKPRKGTNVVLVPDSTQGSRDSLFKTAPTDQQGQYTMNGIVPGNYTVFAFEDLESGAEHDPDFLKPIENYGKKVTIKESSHESVQPDLIPADKTPNM